jgi:hypothetical protein
MARFISLAVIVLALSGCAIAPRQYPQLEPDEIKLGGGGGPTSPSWFLREVPQGPIEAWKTEKHLPVKAGSCAVGILLSPVLAGDCAPATVEAVFTTQAACEAFRSNHPAYTKPDEPCQHIYLQRQDSLGRPVDENGWALK